MDIKQSEPKTSIFSKHKHQGIYAVIGISTINQQFVILFTHDLSESHNYWINRLDATKFWICFKSVPTLVQIWNTYMQL